MDLLSKCSLYRNELDMKKFAHMLDDNTECYKFYWLEALVNLLIRDGKKEITFYEAICEMIAEAWYTISQYHLHMGSIYEGGETRNSIEPGVNLIQKLSGLSATASREKIVLAIDKNKTNSELRKIFRVLVRNVPYRLLSPFVPELDGNDKVWNSKRRIIEYLNSANDKIVLPYYIRYGAGLNSVVVWDDSWAQMIKDNHLIIVEWIRAKKIIYLQNRNPSVPGIIYKLDAEGTRKLDYVRGLWNGVMKHDHIIDVYSGIELNGKRYDIDHFIPWSYVTTDELWNLVPAEKAVNIKKSNNLPDWSKYFRTFLDGQVQLFDSIHKYDDIRDLFEKCRKDNLNALWAAELYDLNDRNQFKGLIEENMRPVYTAARIQGYSIWFM